PFFQKIKNADVPEHPDLRISATRFAYEVFAHLAISHPIPQKKARGCSATGFTQKRHTLYLYYSGFGWKFQMLFE
uniref:hypothetical protein n=1 Tax=Gemmiger formicilis TaxID=745368 RepID=UPI00402500A7